MKKNIVTIMIMALVALNVILTGVIMFVMVPSQTKVNTLVTKISNIIDLDVGSPNATTPLGQVSIADQETFRIDKSINIT